MQDLTVSPTPEETIQLSIPKPVSRLGIVICHRYHNCAGGKCLRALRNREGAFARYREQEVELVGYTSCGGCPGGNIEIAPEEMIKNGASIIHLATGLLVGYPPCPRIRYFADFIRNRYALEVVIGTHPVPQKYYLVHQSLRSWVAPEWTNILEPVLADEPTRLSYN
jgi:predicted metal-binding protein